MDKTNFHELVNFHTGEMLRFTISKVSSKEDAEDIVQDTFLDAFKSYEGFEGRSSPKTWLFSILKNKIFDYHRKRFKLSAESGVDDEYIYFDENGSWKKQFQPHDWPVESNNTKLVEYLKTCIERLPVPLLSTIQLKYFSDLKAEKICQELNISKTNYWQMLHRVRLRLRNCIEKSMEGTV